ncbi:hypothetical protein SH1V18_08970 [Vallitalea longa]|uniref:Lipoprotein n=1 Tax=Vallitalea longa TaxID=2936439 RepID=A0A9W5Y7M9_9FIRM|nr:hypothetical protein [Vallitalea longa]GKX28417.1 hypothetical protein SH1V18_08970 [Vallitalea longa]
MIKMKCMLMSLILCLGITGCSCPIEFSGITSENVFISFDNFYQGSIFLEENDSSFWMKSYRFIDNDTKWKAFKEDYLYELDDFSSVDFETESLYIVVNRGSNGFVRSFDIKELTYNEDTFTVIISQEDSITIDDEQEKVANWINIVKVDKDGFPDMELDWLMIPEHKD